MEERTFKIGKTGCVGKYKKCPVCEKKFEEGEEIVLAPIQKPVSGWKTVMAIPVHVKCYVVK